MNRALLLLGILAAFIIGVGIFFILKFSFPFSAPQPAAVVDSATSSSTPATISPPQPFMYQYLEVTDGCDPYYKGTCVNMRSGPGTQYSVVERLRTGIVLKIAGTVTGTDGRAWYQITQDASIRYPERVKSNWYVLADSVYEFNDDGDHRIKKGEHPVTTKRIVVDLSAEMLYAYDGDVLFMQEPISTGLDFTPTPKGTFSVFAMTPSRYMQGPLPGVSRQVYDLPGVPWNLYFTQDGAVVHGAYWHDHFGEKWSHGCVNLSPTNAKKLYQWAEIGMEVKVEY